MAGLVENNLLQQIFVTITNLKARNARYEANQCKIQR